MKKILLGVLIGILILGTGFGVYYVLENNKGNNSNNNNVNNNDNNSNNNGNNGSDKTVDNNNTNTNNNSNSNSNSNCNTECDCEDKVAKKIDSLVSKYNLTKIERYSAYLNYSYPKDNDSRIRYQFTLTIEDGKLALLRGTSIVADNAGDISYEPDPDFSKIFTKTPKKMLYIGSYLYGAATTLYIIDSDGDLYTLNTDVRGLESSRISKKPSELTFSRVDMKNNKLIDFYISKNDKSKYYVSTTEGKILELNDIYEIKSFKELN